MAPVVSAYSSLCNVSYRTIRYCRQIFYLCVTEIQRRQSVEKISKDHGLRRQTCPVDAIYRWLVYLQNERIPGASLGTSQPRALGGHLANGVN